MCVLLSKNNLGMLDSALVTEAYSTVSVLGKNKIEINNTQLVSEAKYSI